MSKQLSGPALRAMVKQIIAFELFKSVAKLWTIQDVVAHLKCDESTFYRRRAKWKFPAPDIHEGNFIRWLPETVSQWEASRKK